MIFWIDAQLPPQFAPWLKEMFEVEAYSVKFLGLRDAIGNNIFIKAKAAKVTLLSKDSDFVELVQRHGSPPKLIWVTVGNLTNANLRKLFMASFKSVLDLLEGGADIVELSARKDA